MVFHLAGDNAVSGDELYRVDDGYVDRAGLRAFPTTRFPDGQGRKVFEKVGWSEKLLEELSWRIETMRMK